MVIKKHFNVFIWACTYWELLHKKQQWGGNLIAFTYLLSFSIYFTKIIVLDRNYNIKTVSWKWIHFDILIVTLALFLWQILTSYCKFLMSRPFKWTHDTHCFALRGSLVNCIKNLINRRYFLVFFSHLSYEFYYPYIYFWNFNFTTVVLYLTQFSSCPVDHFYGLSFFYVWLLQKSNVMSGGYVTVDRVQCRRKGRKYKEWNLLCW